MGQGSFVLSHCVDFMAQQLANAFSAVVTSPPYNIGVDYGKACDDTRSLEDYKSFTKQWLTAALRVAPVLAINFGAKTSSPVMLCHFGLWCHEVGYLQQSITWAKSVHVDGVSTGHFKPVNSERYLANVTEQILIVSRDGNAPLNKLAVGVPYQDKSNIDRRGHEQDLRDRGNLWFLPYPTRREKLKHPATYPVALAEMMMKLVATSGVIYDPFCGVGSTMAAANMQGWDSVGTDVEEWQLLIEETR